MTLERINPETLSEPGGPYVHVVKAGRLVFVSGQVAWGPDGSVVGVGDIEAQTARVLDNLGTNLHAAGADFGDVTKVTVYVRQMADRAAIAAVRQRYFGAHKPASTLVEVSMLTHPDLLVEIEAIAVVADDD